MNDDYFAGFIDGEGSIQLVRRTGTKYGWHLKIEVCQADPRPLQALQERFGGKVRGPLRYGADHYKPRYMWTISDAQVAACLTALLDKLVVKRREAELALEYRTTVGPSGVRFDSTLGPVRERIAADLKACH